MNNRQALFQPRWRRMKEKPPLRKTRRAKRPALPSGKTAGRSAPPLHRVDRGRAFESADLRADFRRETRRTGQEE